MTWLLLKLSFSPVSNTCSITCLLLNTYIVSCLSYIPMPLPASYLKRTLSSASHTCVFSCLLFETYICYLPLLPVPLLGSYLKLSLSPVSHTCSITCLLFKTYIFYCLSYMFKVLPPHCILQCLPTVTAPSPNYFVSVLSCQCPVLPVSCPASVMSFQCHVLPVSCPASVLSCQCPELSTNLSPTHTFCSLPADFLIPKCTRTKLQPSQMRVNTVTSCDGTDKLKLKFSYLSGSQYI
jgi:hypothetical protein